MMARVETATVCPICGEAAMRISSEPVPVEFREGTFLVEGFEHDHCDACGEDGIDASQIEAMQHAAIALARSELGRLTSNDIHDLRHSLGLTQSQLEAQLGVGRGTVGRWERGDVLQSHMADNFMRLLWAHPELMTDHGLVTRESRGPYNKRGEVP
jgi:putative zinc finger/helix-turn-helix YgiT family protein